MTPTQIQPTASGFNAACWLDTCKAFAAAHPEAIFPKIGRNNPTPDNMPPFAWRLYIALLNRGANGLYHDRKPRHEIMARFQAEAVKEQANPLIWEVLYSVARYPEGYYSLEAILAGKYEYFNRHNNLTR